MNLPDISDTGKMAAIGRLTVLRRKRNDAAKQLRDKLIPMLNSIEHADSDWNISGIIELVEFIQEATIAISKEIKNETNQITNTTKA